jgi:hypothetical protein
MAVETLLLGLFAGAFAVTVLSPAPWRPWIIGVGFVGALGWWIWSLAQGCDEDSEIRCGWQPVVGWLLALVFVAAWLGGVAAALVARRLAGRARR